MTKITIPNTKIRRVKVLLRSKILANKEPGFTDERRLNIVYNPLNGKIGVGKGYTSHYMCEINAAKYANGVKHGAPKLNLWSRVYHCLYNEKNREIKIIGIDNLPVDSHSSELKQSYLRVLSHLISKHKLPFDRILVSTKSGAREVQKSEYDISLKEAVDTICPPHVRKEAVKELE